MSRCHIWLEDLIQEEDVAKVAKSLHLVDDVGFFRWLCSVVGHVTTM